MPVTVKRPELGLAFRTPAQVRELVPAGGRSSKSRSALQCLLVAGLRSHIVHIWMMYFSIWMLYFMVMEPLSFMCPVFVHRPGQADANSYTVHSSPFVFCPSLLFWWAGFPLAWSPLRLQGALEQLLRQMLPGLLASDSHAPPVSRPQMTYVQSIHQDQRELDWERELEADAAYDTTSVDVAC